MRKSTGIPQSKKIAINILLDPVVFERVENTYL